MDDFDKPWQGTDVAGSAALAFANTLDWRLRELPVELLKSFEELLRWARTVSLLDRAEARALRTWARRNPRVAARALARATEVREAIAAVFQSVSRGRPLPKAALARLDEASREGAAARSLRIDKGGARWDWRAASPEPERPAWGAALEAARLLTSEDRPRVRECADAQCGWLFVDTSRNGSRRWCTMKGCGNRNKARRFYRRATSKRRPR
jgi:predicted RNA-binding Zn ribbon-like protein